MGAAIAAPPDGPTRQLRAAVAAVAAAGTEESLGNHGMTDPLS